jgi:hypothetical protein
VAYRRRFLGARFPLLLDLVEDLALLSDFAAGLADTELDPELLDPAELRLIPVGTDRERVPRSAQM